MQGHCKPEKSSAKQISKVRKETALHSTSKEVRFLSRIVLTDQRSNLCRNISYLSDVTKLNDVTMVAGWKIRQALKERCTLEPWNADQI